MGFQFCCVYSNPAPNYFYSSTSTDQKQKFICKSCLLWKLSSNLSCFQLTQLQKYCRCSRQLSHYFGELVDLYVMCEKVIHTFHRIFCLVAVECSYLRTTQAGSGQCLWLPISGTVRRTPNRKDRKKNELLSTVFLPRIYVCLEKFCNFSMQM